MPGEPREIKEPKAQYYTFETLRNVTTATAAITVACGVIMNFYQQGTDKEIGTFLINTIALILSICVVLATQFKREPSLGKPQYALLLFFNSLLLYAAVVGTTGITSSFRSIQKTRDQKTTASIISFLLPTRPLYGVSEKVYDKTKQDLVDVNQELVVTQDSAQSKVSNLKKEVNSVSKAYTKVTSQVAFLKASEKNIQSQQKLNDVVTETSVAISNILLKNASADLLQNAIVKVHYLEPLRTKAADMDKLLRSKGVSSDYSLPGYSISGTKENEIVYYNKPQLNYCLAVQSLLKQSGFGDFRIRSSSGANATTQFFKIYIVK